MSEHAAQEYLISAATFGGYTIQNTLPTVNGAEATRQLSPVIFAGTLEQVLMWVEATIYRHVPKQD